MAQAKELFCGLNYTLGNEDTTFEYRLVQQLRPKRILSVCGSGGRSLPLLAHGAQHLCIVDCSQEQLWLAQLRTQTYLQFSYSDFLFFWGYYPRSGAELGKRREELFKQLQLTEECQKFFLKLYKEIHWDSLLYLGKWERTFQKLSQIVQKVMGKNGKGLFHCKNLQEQKKYLAQNFSHWRWRTILFIFGNATVFNALMYRGHFVRKNIPQSYIQFYSAAFQRLFTHTWAPESFFLNLLFFGEINSAHGNPIEAQEQTFKEIKTQLQKNSVIATTADEDGLRFVCGDLIATCAQQGNFGDHRFDFVSLSDVPSYFSGDTEKNYLQKMRKGLNYGAVVVLRSYLRVPQMDTQGFVEITDNYLEIIQQEKVQMYKIQIFKLID